MNDDQTPFDESEARHASADNDPSPARRRMQPEDASVAKCQPQRLAKILAAAGIDARRKCEEYVTTGRVTVDGAVITDLAFRADPYSQKIELDGEKLKLHRKVYFVLNKPRGVVCTNFDPAGRPRVIDLFPNFRERLFTIGRLDEESEGLLLVTNDGELANRMAHPRYRVPKFYLCHVKGVPSAETLATLKRGIHFEEGKFSVEGVRMKKVVGESAYLDIVLNEGQNREIRRLMARVDHKVMRLKRVGFGPIRIGDLPNGAFRPLTTAEVHLLSDLSQQRAHLDNTAGRGRKKKFGDKPAFGGKPKFGSKPPLGKPAYGKPPLGKSAYGKPPRGTKSGYGSSSDRQQRYGAESTVGNRPPRRLPANAANESFAASADETEFNGGRRRFVTDETSESSFSRRPARGGRPQRRRFVKEENSQPESGGDSSQRRPSRGPRRNSQASNRELPPRGRGRPPARPPRPMTADGKEILEGKVTGYRSMTKEGPARRRRNAIQGMQVNRKHRQQKRRKTEE